MIDIQLVIFSYIQHKDSCFVAILQLYPMWFSRTICIYFHNLTYHILSLTVAFLSSENLQICSHHVCYPIFPISYFERPPMLYIMWYMNLCFTQKFLNVLRTKKAVFDLKSHLPLLGLCYSVISKSKSLCLCIHLGVDGFLKYSHLYQIRMYRNL